MVGEGRYFFPTGWVSGRRGAQLLTTIFLDPCHSPKAPRIGRVSLNDPMGSILIIPILQIQKLRLREVKLLPNIPQL